MTPHAAAWQAAIRLANDRPEPGDEERLAAVGCICNHCLDRAYREAGS